MCRGRSGSAIGGNAQARLVRADRRWHYPRMGWRRSKPKRVPGEYPENFVKGWMATTLPSATPAEAASAVRHLRGKGWSEEDLVRFILPYMPREPSPAPPPRDAHGQPAIALPPVVTTDWLDEHLPAMDLRQLRNVVDELERRGLPPGTMAMAVLPHLLPKLPPEEARALVAGLANLGMTDDEIARATRR